jgi:2,4-dienoyl-CoA reductase (NADPH2)
MEVGLMTKHERFSFENLEQLKSSMEENAVNLPLSEDLSSLSKPLQIGGKTIPNRLVINPMEGCDGEGDGSPSDLVYRRYERFAKGGAGLLWVEATAVTEDGRANPRQLYYKQSDPGWFQKAG